MYFCNLFINQYEHKFLCKLFTGSLKNIFFIKKKKTFFFVFLTVVQFVSSTADNNLQVCILLWFFVLRKIFRFRGVYTFVLQKKMFQIWGTIGPPTDRSVRVGNDRSVGGSIDP